MSADTYMKEADDAKVVKARDLKEIAEKTSTNGAEQSAAFLGAMQGADKALETVKPQLEKLSETVKDGFATTYQRLDWLGEFADANRVRVENVQDRLTAIREAQRESSADKTQGRAGYHKPAKRVARDLRGDGDEGPSKPKERKIPSELYSKRMNEGKCFKCGLAGHRADKCPNGHMDQNGNPIK